jgi:hypothetical protein
MAVWCPFCKPSLCRHVHYQFMRNALHNFTTIVPVTVYHQGRYFETYSRFNWTDLWVRAGGFPGACVYLLSAPLTIPLICCHIKSFRPACSCGEAMARRQKEERRAGLASRGMVRRLGRFASRVHHRLSPIARGCLSGATPRGQPWTSAVTLPQGCNGLSAWLRAVLNMFRKPSLCHQVHGEFMRSTLRALPPMIPATACHQRNDIERYSRYKTPESNKSVVSYRLLQCCHQQHKAT